MMRKMITQSYFILTCLHKSHIWLCVANGYFIWRMLTNILWYQNILMCHTFFDIKRHSSIKTVMVAWALKLQPSPWLIMHYELANVYLIEIIMFVSEQTQNTTIYLNVTQHYNNTSKNNHWDNIISNKAHLKQLEHDDTHPHTAILAHHLKYKP